MLSYSSDTGWVFDPLEATLLLMVIGFNVYRTTLRKRSLHQKDDGTFVWIEWHGGERSSPTDPSEPGGEWDCDGDGDGGD